MSGEELKNWLKENNYVLRHIADGMSITEQDLQSKLKAKSLKSDFIAKVERQINTSIKLDKIIKAPEGKTKRRIKGNGDKVEFYDVDFEAGTGVEFYDDIRGGTPSYIMDVPDFKGCTAFRSYGKSMDGLIDSGAILFGTKEEDWKEYVEYGQIYGIVCHNKRRFLKYVRRSRANPATHFLLVSENKEEFDDFELPIDKIKSMWLIHGWLNKRT